MIDNQGRRFGDAPSIHSRSRFGYWEADIACGKTGDRGSEFTKYKEFHEVLGVKVYFPDSHPLHQRVTNENTNGF